MRVMVHNGARRPLDADAHPTVGAVVDALLGAGADAHALVSIAVDGCGVDLDELGELRALPCAGVGELVVETRPLRAVASDALESASQYGAELAGALRRTAGLLQDGARARANALWAAAVDGVVVWLGAVNGAAAALGADGAPLAEVERELAAPLEALADAWERDDTIAIADLLEHELARRIEGWAARLAALPAGREG